MPSTVGLEPDARRTVSLFRSTGLKRLIPARLLAAIESPLQGPLGGMAPGPSIYVRSIRLDAATIDEIAPGPVRRPHVEDDTCGS